MPKKAPSSTAASTAQQNNNNAAATVGSASTPSTTMTSAAKEKRALRYRASCPTKLYGRLERAETQRLYLVERTIVSAEECHFAVLGSTGNVYQVKLCEIPTCTCLDFVKKQDVCKHMMFVTLKVIGLSKDDPLCYQRAYIPSELHHLLHMIQERRVGGGTQVLANDTVRRSYAKLQHGGGEDVEDGGDEDGNEIDSKLGARRPLDCDSDCPICFDSLQPNGGGAAATASKSTKTDGLTYCKGTCGTNFHSDCIRAWMTRGGSKTCPACRQPWIDDNATTTNNEGYVNLGPLQGQSPERDTSTYYQRGSPYYKRGRYNKRRRYDDDDG